MAAPWKVLGAKALVPGLLSFPDGEAYRVQLEATGEGEEGEGEGDPAEAILMLSVLDAVLPALSRTWAVNVDDPAAVGVPEITPEEDKVNPAFSDPLSRDHV